MTYARGCRLRSADHCLLPQRHAASSVDGPTCATRRTARGARCTQCRGRPSAPAAAVMPRSGSGACRSGTARTAVSVRTDWPSAAATCPNCGPSGSGRVAERLGRAPTAITHARAPSPDPAHRRSSPPSPHDHTDSDGRLGRDLLQRASACHFRHLESTALRRLKQPLRPPHPTLRPELSIILSRLVRGIPIDVMSCPRPPPGIAGCMADFRATAPCATSPSACLIFSRTSSSTAENLLHHVIASPPRNRGPGGAAPMRNRALLVLGSRARSRGTGACVRPRRSGRGRRAR